MSHESLSALGGRCLCGAVSFSATPLNLTMSVCHCSMCRRWAGGVGMAVACAPDVRIDDEQALGVYRSSDWGERGFCKTCGSSLFWRARDGSALVVSAMAFEDPAQFELKTEIFVDEQPCNYAFAQPTRRLTGAEAVAAFSKPDPS